MVYVAMSLATFIAFWLDKRAAIRGRGQWRIPESTLHLLELLGGFPGALAGQRFLRHKSYKLSYRVTLWSIALLHVAGWLTIGWFTWR